jgi:hypothetical protein
MRGDLDHPEFVVGDGSAEFSSQASAPAALRIGREMTDLGDGQRRNHQTRPVASKELSAPRVVAVSLVEGCDERSRIAQDQADAAPLASSRSG